MTDTPDWFDPYCKVCGSCGEDGCCPSWKCTHGEGCKYPKQPNTLLVKLARNFRFFRRTYRFWQNLPLTLMRIFVCSIIGHKKHEYFEICSRCYHGISSKGEGTI